MKYGELTLGQVEAIVNKLGGMEGVKRFLAGKAVVAASIKDIFLFDRTKDGWTLWEDVPFYGQPFTPDIVEFLKSGEFSVNGYVLQQRARELHANLGQRHAEYLLNHQKLISKEWRQYFLVFPGTVWQDCDGRQYVSYLFYHDGRWCLEFDWLENIWTGYGRLVSLRG